MQRPRHIKGALRLFPAALLSLCLLLSVAHAFGQEQQSNAAISADMAQAIELYRKGSTKEAIEAFRKIVKEKKTDALAWHYLGLSLARDANQKEARKAFETAVKLKPDFAAARISWAYMLLLANKNSDAAREAEKALQLEPGNAESQYIIGVVNLRAGEYTKALERAEAALKSDPGFATAFLLKSQALVGTQSEGAFSAPPEESSSARRLRFKEAAESLEKYLQLNPSAARSEFWRDQLEALKFFSTLSNAPQPSGKVFSSHDVTTKARILNRPEPQYTESARQSGVQGTVVLRAVFAADGRVKYIFVIKGLDYGLTEACIRAARSIRFIPATIDGRPVSQYVQIEYNFNLY